MPFSNQNKSADPTWNRFVRRGKTQTMGDLAEFDFTESVEENGKKSAGDSTIASFAEDSIQWSNLNKS